MTDVRTAEVLEKVVEEVPQGEDRARIETVIRSVVATFGFLSDFGYEMEEIDISSSELHKYQTSFSWCFDRANREVSISYSPFDYEGRRCNTLHISIVKTSDADKGGKSEFEATDDYMNLRMYVESKCPDFDKRVLEVSNYEGSFAERVEKTLRAYAYYMQDVAEDVIRGEYWESGHFHHWH